MSWTSLKMISLGSLLLFGERPLCAGGSPCVSENEANQIMERFHKNRPGPWVPLNDHRTTCEDVARLLESEAVASQLKGEHMTRSVSPWRYRIDRNINRSPAEIPMAECLCKGCILEHKETHDYNSRGPGLLKSSHSSMRSVCSSVVVAMSVEWCFFYHFCHPWTWKL